MSKKLTNKDATLAKCADEIRKLEKNTKDHAVKNAIKIGHQLTIAKDAAGHGGWLPWLKREFNQYSDRHALNFMRAYEMLLKSEIISDLEVTGLFLLAAPSVPDAARDEVAARAQSGEKMTTAKVKEAIDRKKKKAAPAKKSKAAKAPKAPKAATEAAGQSTGNGSDPDEGAALMKAAHSGNEPAPEPVAEQVPAAAVLITAERLAVLTSSLFSWFPDDVADALVARDRSYAVALANAILARSPSPAPVLAAATLAP
jgi:hypothetical protein